MPAGVVLRAGSELSALNNWIGGTGSVVVISSIVILLPLPPIIIRVGTMSTYTQDISRCCLHLYDIEIEEYMLYNLL